VLFKAQSLKVLKTMNFSLFTVDEVLRFPRRKRNDRDEFLKPHEAAELLKVSEVEFLDAVYSGDIPGKRISGRWRFSRVELMRLCKLRNNHNPTPCLREESMYFFDDDEAHEGRVERIIEAYRQGVRSFIGLDAVENGNFSGLDLTGISFWDIGLKGANFSRCILRDASFTASDLEAANFEEADLTGVSFREAFVGDANFTKANLTNADFQVGYISGADLSGAKIWQTRF
jgi:hypothetical protein